MATDWKKRDEEERSERITLHDLVGPLAQLLGAGWSVEAPREDEPSLPSYYTLHGPDGAELGLSGGTWGSKGKITITAHFNDRKDGVTFWYLPYKVERPSISVTGTRGALVVAKEIARRLLPDYMPLLISCNEARARWETRKRNGHAVAVSLAHYIGAAEANIESDVRNSDGSTYKINVYRSEALAGSHVDVKVRGSEDSEQSVRIDNIDVPPHVAAELLAVLVRHHHAVKEED
jgi:hypothetical protein